MTQEIHDAFQELKGLEEATFSFDKDGVMELMSFLDDAQDESENGTIDIYDPNADTEGDLKDDYAGEVVLRCCICGALIPLSPKEVIIDAATHRANVDLACPCCYNTGGYKIVSELKPKTVNVDADSFDMDDEGGLQIDLDNVNIDDGDAVTESYELLNGTVVKCFSDHDKAEGYANSKGYKLAEYGNLGGGIDGDFAYAYWNETGDKNDDELVIAYYAFDDDGKARPLTQEEKDYIAKKQEVEFDDAPIKEDYNKDTNSIYNFLKKAVNGLKDGSGTNYRYKLDDRFAIFVGWSDGYAEDDGDVIHNEDRPTEAITVGIKVWTSDDMWTDFDFLNSPYYADGSVLDSDTYVRADTDDTEYLYLTSSLLREYDDLRDLVVDKDGKVIEEKEEIEESLNEAKNPKFIRKRGRPLTEDEIDKFVDVINSAVGQLSYKGYRGIFDVSSISVDESNNVEQKSPYADPYVEITLPTSTLGSRKFKNFYGDTISDINNIIFNCRYSEGYTEGTDEDLDEGQYAVRITTDGTKKDYKQRADKKYRWEGTDFYLYDDTISEFESGIKNWIAKFIDEILGNFPKSFTSQPYYGEQSAKYEEPSLQFTNEDLSKDGVNIIGRKGAPIKEGVSIISSLDEYKPWSGAVDTFEAIQDADKVDALDRYLEDIYPEGLTVTQLNDILWFDGESVLKDLGIFTEDAIKEAIDDAVVGITYSLRDFDELAEDIEASIKDKLDETVDVSVDRDGDTFIVSVNDVEKEFDISDFKFDEDVDESLEKKPNSVAEAEINERACRGKRAKRGSKEINEHLRGAEVIEFPSGDYLYVVEEDGKLIAGGATNTGIFRDYEIDLDGDDVTDSDLQRLYDVIVAEHPEYEEEMSESCKRDKKKSLVEQVADNAYEVADEIEAQIGDKISITWDEFDSYYKRACDKVLGKSGVPYDDFETDVRSILSMSGWGTDFEGDNEGGLSRVTEESLTEAKEQEDTWDKVYDAVATVKGVTVKPDYISTNKDDEIVVSKLSAEDLKKVEDAIKAKFADMGVSTRTGKYKFDKKFPDYLAIKVPDEQIIKDIKVKQSKDGKLDESVSNIQITTDDDVTSVDIDKEGGVNVNVTPSIDDEGISEESSDVSVTTESEDGDVVFGEVDDSTVAEIEDNSGEDDTSEEGVEEVIDAEETVEEPVDETEEEGTDEIEEIDETEFDELGESYLKSVYDNVKGFRTTAGYINNNRLKLEGIITFNSGKKAKTSFVFEKYTTTSRGKYKLIGENVQLTNRKNAFILTGTINNHKLCLESLTYSYTAKDANGGKSIRVYGTKKLSENLKNKK